MFLRSYLDVLRKGGGNLSFLPRLAEDHGDLGATQQASRRHGGRSGQGQLYSMPARGNTVRGDSATSPMEAPTAPA